MAQNSSAKEAIRTELGIKESYTLPELAKANLVGRETTIKRLIREKKLTCRGEGRLKRVLGVDVAWYLHTHQGAA
jgi:hypothetical protein